MRPGILFRTHINFEDAKEAKKFFKTLKIFSSVRDQLINGAYVDPMHLGHTVRIDIETDSEKTFKDIYREITVHLLVGNGFKPVNDQITLYDNPNEEERLSMLNGQAEKIYKKISGAA